ncbi:unnamed protein product [Rangifer tarandus platyrhynchus]|uniref:Uncharacterized protein n=1 Tax=Rangifer tarandus platyrhynchus TaxID=3082113 RepID=A0AC59Y0A5_RANTA
MLGGDSFLLCALLRLHLSDCAPDRLSHRWFPLHTVYSGPSYPQLDHSWALLPPAALPPSPSKGVTWADEIIPTPQDSRRNSSEARQPLPRGRRSWRKPVSPASGWGRYCSAQTLPAYPPPTSPL